jgi:hypothetical protein
MTTERYAAQRQVITGKIEFAGRIVVLAIGLLLLSRNITDTFTGWREDNSALYSFFARNHIHYGLGYTKLFHTHGNTQNMPPTSERYLNNPPLLGFWVAIPMFVFGDHEWAGRSVPIAATLGSAWLLMAIISRLQTRALGLLAGFFYVMLPMTAYFGRIIEYTSPAQFFSLLMLHGYLQWNGLYGSGCDRRAGVICYATGVVLGTGTSWAAVIMAGLIWLWHLCRAWRDSSQLRLLPWLTLVPAVSLGAVLLHIAWGAQWKVGWLVSLLLSRTAGPLEDPVSWREWFGVIWVYLKLQMSPYGVGAGVIYLGVIPAVLRYTSADSPLRRVVRSRAAVTPVLLCLLQGLTWVFIFKRPSYLHEYWQYFLAPYFAVAMAAVVLAVFLLVSKKSVRLAAGVAILLIVLPSPFFLKRLSACHRISKFPTPYNIHIHSLVSAFKGLNRYVGPGVPVMTSENYYIIRHIGDRISCGVISQAVYYANRPTIYTKDVNEIEANSQHCAAYILWAASDPDTYQLAPKLEKKYKLVAAEGDILTFLLNPPERHAK